MHIAVLIALTDDKDLVFTEFQLFLRPEGSNGSGQRSDKAGCGVLYQFLSELSKSQS